jgi:predicted acylesterase/phospholipase RssA
MKCDYGIVLSGGGARGIAHLGNSKSKKNLCIKPVTLGTSSSALLDFMPMVLY